MQSLTTNYLASLTYSPEDAAALRLLGEYRGKQQLYAQQRPETLASLRTAAVIESTESSNRLEGITAPKARLKALVAHKTEPQDRSENEIAGYRDALELIHQSAADMPVTTNVVRQLHRDIYQYMPEAGGNWKMTDNKIVERDTTGEIIRVRFKAVSAVATPQAMDDLIERYHQALDLGQDALIVIPLFVLDFLCIHPFRDGNGRIARLLTLLLTYQAGYEVGRFISLERLFEQSRESYYKMLESSSFDWHDATHDPMPWLRYSWGILLKAYSEFEERVGNIALPRGSKSQRVREAVQRKVMPFRIVDLERDLPGVSRETIRMVLREMKRGGQVKSTGRGPGARWHTV